MNVKKITLTIRQFLLLNLALVCLLISCAEEDESGTSSFTFDFEDGRQSWTAGFSDYPAEWDANRLAFMAEIRELPEGLNQDDQAFFITGTNLSDDLFLFIKRQITGLAPDQTYRLTFEVELASQYPEESMGIGGSPGGSVYLKAGGSTDEPQTTVTERDVRMNIDKGNQAQGGENMVVTGTVGIPGDEFSYQLIQRENLDNPVRVRTDGLGNLWVIIGTDSGFEGTTALYYNSIAVTLEE